MGATEPGTSRTGSGGAAWREDRLPQERRRAEGCGPPCTGQFSGAQRTFQCRDRHLSQQLVWVTCREVCARARGCPGSHVISKRSPESSTPRGSSCLCAPALRSRRRVSFQSPDPPGTAGGQFAVRSVPLPCLCTPRFLGSSRRAMAAPRTADRTGAHRGSVCGLGGRTAGHGGGERGSRAPGTLPLCPGVGAPPPTEGDRGGCAWSATPRSGGCQAERGSEGPAGGEERRWPSRRAGGPERPAPGQDGTGWGKAGAPRGTARRVPSAWDSTVDLRHEDIFAKLLQHWTECHPGSGLRVKP